MAIFGREIIGRQVLDQTGEGLGVLIDLQFDTISGSISDFVVEVHTDIDITKLPFESNGNMVKIPATSVNTVAKEIHLCV